MGDVRFNGLFMLERYILNLRVYWLLPFTMMQNGRTNGIDLKGKEASVLDVKCKVRRSVNNDRQNTIVDNCVVSTMMFKIRTDAYII